MLVSGQSILRQLIREPIRLDKSCRAPELDYDFTNKCDDGGKKYFRANQPYERPYGSYRIGLKVKNRFGNDNVWLDEMGTEPGEWPVSYHGTAEYNAQSIAEEGYRLDKSVRSLHRKGIYSTPEVAVAKKFATEFKHDGDSYLCIFQNRVNPKYLQVIPKEKARLGIYWLSHGGEDEVDENELIRPYGICLFKI